MKSNSAPDGASLPGRERLAAAHELYQAIFRALRASLETLQSGQDSPAEARHRQELIRAHIKQLQQVFELEESLGTFGTTASAARLDLEAARAEIRERLARLRGGGGGREVPGGA